MRGKPFKALTSLAAAAMLLFSSAGVVAQADTGPVQPSAGGASVGAQACTPPCLVDQLNSPVSVGVVSQDYEADFSILDSQAADDFVASGGKAWGINKVEVLGQYTASGPNASAVNVQFYTNANGLPGALVYDTTVAPASDANGAFVINLVRPAVLTTPGTYWVAVQAVLSFGTGGRQWYWTVQTQQNNESAWHNTGNSGQYPPQCSGTNWGARSTTCGQNPTGGETYKDMTFRLSGTIYTTAVYLPVIRK